MTDDQLRALVRDAVTRHLGGSAGSGALDRSASCDHDRAGCDDSSAAAVSASWQQHPSHHVYVTVVNTTEACVIEPAVACNHCNYCKSHGH